MARVLALTCFLIMAVAGALTTVRAQPARAAGTWTWPVQGEVITPFRNGGDPYAGGQHRGIDVAAGSGTPVVAAAGGTVRFAGVAGSSGLTVSLRTADRRFDTSYLHLSAVEVRKGDRVDTGARIGAVGRSGRRSTAAEHLHFGVRDAESRHAYRDPLDFLAPPPVAPVRDAPRGAPAPVRVPVGIVPVPSPVRGPMHAPRPVPVRPRGRVPAGRRLRVPDARRAPRGAVPALRPVAVRHGFRTPARTPTPTRPGLPRRSPSAGPAPALGPLPRAALPPSPARRRAAGPDASGRLDLGWGLACAGLLLAAACLGRPEDRRRHGERVRPVLRALLRPLTGGR